MYAEKLLKLAEIVERAVEQQGVQFDFVIYGHSQKGNVFDLSCGTTACMAGIAAASGEFPGLEAAASTVGGRGMFHPSSHDGIGLHAMEETFGLTWEEAVYLFMPTSYSQIGLATHGPMAARHGVNRIRDFVKNGLPANRRFH